MSDVEIPVLIAGGGPAGLGASIGLSERGVRSLLVEQHPTTTAHPKATVVNARTYELFRHWGIDEEIRRGGLPFDKSRFIVWATSLTGYELGRLDLAADQLNEANENIEAARRQLGRLSPGMTGICPQDVYEPIMRRRAESFAGAEVRFHSQLVRFAAGAAGVEATVRSLDDGREQEVRAQYLLACDGAASGIREQLGIEMIGPDNLGSLLNVYFHAALTPYINGREGPLYWILNADVAGVFIALDNRERWLFNTPFRLAADETVARFTPEVCAALIRRAAGVPTLAIDVRSVDPWIMRSQVAERYRDGRVFLIGDAAHRFPPTGGFGMNTGVQDAHNLAWKIAAVLQGWAAPELLDTYDEERRPVGQFNADQSFKNSKQIPAPGGGRESPLAVIEDDSPEGESVRQMIAAGIGGTREHFSATGQVKGFAYQSAAITQDEGGGTDARSTVDRYVPTACPGGIAPHCWIRRNGRLDSLLDLFGDGFVLLAGPGGDAWHRAAEAAVAEGLPRMRVHQIGRDVQLADAASDEWVELYGVGPDGAVLIRPDGHVAWRTRSLLHDPGGSLRRAYRRAVGDPEGVTFSSPGQRPGLG